MGGVFINYRRGDHSATVEDLYAELERYFGSGQVFLDRPSLLPGQRFSDALRARVDDCEVLLAVLHPGWAEVRDASGARRLDHEEDWVRQEIEQAFAGGKVVIPVLLDGAVVPRPEELPASIREIVAVNGQPLRRAHRDGDVAELIAVLERDVRADWEPVPAPEERARPGRWLGVLTAVLACAVLAGVPALPQDDSWAGTDVLPYTLSLALMSTLLLCAPLIAVAAVRLVRRSVDDLERDLHAVRHQTYIRQTWPIGVGFVLVGGSVGLSGGPGPVVAFALLLVLSVAVARAARTHLRLKKRDADLWARWPHRLPARVTRVVLRRAAARLHLRLDRMTAPLSLEQREKAAWELDDITGALGRVAREAQRPRRAWLSQDHPLMLAGYVLWLALTAALFLASGLAYATEGEGTVRRYVALGVMVLIGAATALGTLETAYRYQRRQRRELVRQISGFRDGLVLRVAEMSRPARTKPTAPAPRPEEFAEPD
ncbi:toll/interleukin-1 receptor domain-containing protein [Streptomyces sp. S.PB5]|uniref:toll/interleukin-1 receptor domain-containing protein n=1 Tax=Streptomyces sp. S.PB5 TaxID=3020844 RepID=UPI0025AFE6C0|nr:toll/interleukin-1 receptor domain-containing protein [Streptomyces sp. S.PB5]MDN3023171.1 toll/interleukin-1 receptor domain-containing protein [Streptomyces sp. S.PB5]